VKSACANFAEAHPEAKLVLRLELFNWHHTAAVVEVLAHWAAQVSDNKPNTQNGRKDKNTFATINPIDNCYKQRKY